MQVMSGDVLNFLLDGYVIIEFTEYCDANQIALYYAPPHTTYIPVTITKALEICGVHFQVTLNKLQTTKEISCTDIFLPNQPPPTPKSSTQIVHL